MGFAHVSVLSEEVIAFLAPRAGGIYVDGTLGGGGHAALILDVSVPDGLVIGLDRDKDALEAASKNLRKYGSRFIAVHSNFSDIEKVLADLGLQCIDGVLLDLGVSSYQLDKAERGFSFQQDAPLDMRMDASTGDTAADLVNDLPEQALARIFWEYGEERWSSRIAKRIVDARRISRIETTFQLVEIVKGSIPRAKWEERIHPATRTFQAIRIAVNRELESLEQGLTSTVKFLRKGGRVVVISFHSLEDRIVKNTFRDLARSCVCPKNAPVCMCGKVSEVKVLTGKPVLPGEDEIQNNPRARSAKLRAAEKIT